MLTRAADYASRVMTHLASLPPGTRVQLSGLAEATDVPASFMSNVLQNLVRARLVSSRPGLNGGFELAVAADEVTLLDIVEAIDGRLQVNVCVDSPQGCGRQSWCAAHPVWMQAQEALTRILRSATVARLAEQSTLRRAGHTCRLGAASSGRKKSRRNRAQAGTG